MGNKTELESVTNQIEVLESLLNDLKIKQTKLLAGAEPSDVSAFDSKPLHVLPAELDIFYEGLYQVIQQNCALIKDGLPKSIRDAIIANFLLELIREINRTSKFAPMYIYSETYYNLIDSLVYRLITIAKKERISQIIVSGNEYRTLVKMVITYIEEFTGSYRVGLDTFSTDDVEALIFKYGRNK